MIQRTTTLTNTASQRPIAVAQAACRTAGAAVLVVVDLFQLTSGVPAVGDMGACLSIY